MGTVTRLRPRARTNTPLELITWRRDQDLREVSQAEDILKGWVRKCKLKDGQVALFSNKMEDRFRMVTLYNGVPMLIILPVGKTRQFRRQLYAKLAEWIVESFLMRDSVERKLITIDIGLEAAA
jgi:hypothetical protein